MKKFTTILLASSILSLSSFAAYAQSEYYGASSFEGFYAGVFAGGKFNPAAVTNIGGAAGVNFAVTDSILAGVEMQGSATLAATPTYDALMLGRVGYEVNDDIMVYGAAGGGLIDGTTSYAVGGGAEAMIVQQVGIRAEGLATGEWGKNVDSSKLSLGVMWHMQ